MELLRTLSPKCALVQSHFWCRHSNARYAAMMPVGRNAAPAGTWKNDLIFGIFPNNRFSWRDQAQKCVGATAGRQQAGIQRCLGPLLRLAQGLDDRIDRIEVASGRASRSTLSDHGGIFQERNGREGAIQAAPASGWPNGWRSQPRTGRPPIIRGGVHRYRSKKPMVFGNADVRSCPLAWPLTCPLTVMPLALPST